MRERLGLLMPVCFTEQTISHSRQPVHFSWSITNTFSMCDLHLALSSQVPNIWHLSSPVNARYVRFYITNNQGGSVIWFSIFEVGYLT